MIQPGIDRPDRSPHQPKDAEQVGIDAAGALAFRECRILLYRLIVAGIFNRLYRESDFSAVFRAGRLTTGPLQARSPGIFPG